MAKAREFEMKKEVVKRETFWLPGIRPQKRIKMMKFDLACGHSFQREYSGKDYWTTEKLCQACKEINLMPVNKPEHDPNKRYSIVRFNMRIEGPAPIQQMGLTLEEARKWCKDPAHHGQDWFDGYKEEP